VIHIAGHAIANREFPSLSRLLMAPENAGTSGDLYGEQIAQLRLPATRLVVLAACDSAVGPVLHGEGALSLARPFLMAGTAAVVATNWAVDDYATRRLMNVLHARFAMHGDAARALRESQLQLLGSADPELRHPRSWGAAILISGVVGTQ
jgi:CHAT domain-containing protein